jgi:hypothetical protein
MWDLNRYSRVQREDTEREPQISGIMVLLLVHTGTESERWLKKEEKKLCWSPHKTSSQLQITQLQYERGDYHSAFNEKDNS